MGQKLVYNIITSQCINGQWGFATVAFSITSKKKAQLQMDTIHSLVDKGEWFVGSDKTYKIVYDTPFPVDGQPSYVRDILIECVETGVIIPYRLIESPLNSMYISK